MAFLEMNKLSKRYGDVEAVVNLSLNIRMGQFVVVVGPSGSGKTTFLRLIAGFEALDSGEIQLANENISRETPENRAVGMVFQDYALFPHMNVMQNISYGLKFQSGLSKASKYEIVDDLLTMMDIRELGDRMPDELSSGQQQRVAIARSLAPKPSVLLLDEPFSALDASLRDELRWELRALQQRLKLTIIQVTHDQDEALGLADMLVVMNNGSIEQSGMPQEIYKAPLTPFVSQFIGRGNVIAGTLISSNQKSVEVEIEDGQKIVATAEFGLAIATQDSMQILIRPENFKIDSTLKNQFEATVIQSEFQGHSYLLKCTIAGQICFARLSVEQFEQIESPLDGTILLGVDPSAIRVL